MAERSSEDNKALAQIRSALRCSCICHSGAHILEFEACCDQMGKTPEQILIESKKEK
jgi:hypothetical protein